jgi:hypothetical protein
MMCIFMFYVAPSLEYWDFMCVHAFSLPCGISGNGEFACVVLHVGSNDGY